MGNPLVPKSGIDKNGKQYTRNVKVDQPAAANDRISKLPTPYVDSLTSGYTLSPAKDIVSSTHVSQRLENVTAEQLDEAHNIMQRFGVDAADLNGFRRFLINGSVHGEWTERGFGSRVYRDTIGNKMTNIHLYSISDYSYGDTYPEYYEGQAELRQVFGFPKYDGAEVAFLAGRYWDSHILPTLGEIPRDGARGLRDGYVKEIMKQPELTADIVDALQKQPRDVVGHLETYLKTIPFEDTDVSAVMGKLDEGKFGMARNEFAKLRGYSTEQKSAVLAKIDEMEKEAKRQKRLATKAAAGA